jgi:hypothetical protein
MKTRTGTEERQLPAEKRTGTCNYIEGYTEPQLSYCILAVLHRMHHHHHHHHHHHYYYYYYYYCYYYYYYYCCCCCYYYYCCCCD